VPLVWLEFEVPETTVLARVARRRAAGNDASDASADVVHRQLAAREPIAADELESRDGAEIRRVELREGDVASLPEIPFL